MKNLFRALILAVAFVSVCNAANQDRMAEDALSKFSQSIQNVTSVKTIAVYPFEYTDKVKLKNIEDRLILKITESGKFRVIDRKDIEVLIKEQALSMAGIVENKDMAEIGKMKGADAFLFGRVDIAGDSLIINLLLKEVATGSILWSSELRGKDYSRMALGTGIRLGSYSATSVIAQHVSSPGTSSTVETLDDGIYTAFLFYFVQRMYKSQYFSFGVDGIFSLGFWQSQKTDEAISGYTLNSISNYRDYNLSLIPILRVHLAKLVNPKGEDFFVVYGGTGISTDFMNLKGTYSLKDGGTEKLTTKTINQTHLWPGAFSYKLGFEVIFTPKFSMFFEGYHMPQATMNWDIDGGNLVDTVTYTAGNHFGIGAKYYFMVH